LTTPPWPRVTWPAPARVFPPQEGRAWGRGWETTCPMSLEQLIYTYAYLYSPNFLLRNNWLNTLNHEKTNWLCIIFRGLPVGNPDKFVWYFRSSNSLDIDILHIRRNGPFFFNLIRELVNFLWRKNISKYEDYRDILYALHMSCHFSIYRISHFLQVWLL
jgi:hypothetical protein